MLSMPKHSLKWTDKLKIADIFQIANHSQRKFVFTVIHFNFEFLNEVCPQ